ncbi:putative transmembrane protein [Halotydeus destructor]|nr:putative transmembrane protein [Halotydeus destructor]
MSVLSKALNPEWSVCYNCYEIGHVWTPDCSDAALDIFFAAFTESLKMYTPLYVLSQAFFARKFNAATFMETFKSILRSSCFLSSNALTIIMFFCMTRAMTGRFYYRMHAYIPTFIGSLMAIVIEKPSRRMPLAIYVANIASECLFRLQVEKGTSKPSLEAKYYYLAPQCPFCCT